MVAIIAIDFFSVLTIVKQNSTTTTTTTTTVLLLSATTLVFERGGEGKISDKMANNFF